MGGRCTIAEHDPQPSAPGDPTTTCPGDLNGDCQVEAFDLAILVGNWGP